ncbi:glycosyltransferase [Myxococcota bacterium]|nr:glycosyltransferase [Myxococcota bacterium]
MSRADGSPSIPLAERLGLPAGALPRLSVVVFTRDDAEQLQGCLAALESDPPPFPLQVVVFDNASRDRTAEVCAAFPGVERIHSPVEVGYSHGNNAGLARVRAPLVLFLNPDTRPHAAALVALVDAFDRHPGPVLLGLPMVNPDGSPQPSSFAVPTLRGRFAGGVVRRAMGPPSPGRIAPAGWLLGAALAGRTSFLREVQGFDESFWAYGTDLELCARARARGALVAQVGAPPIPHAGNPNWTPERRQRVWGALLRWALRDLGPGRAELLRLSLTAACVARGLAERPGGRSGWWAMARWTRQPLEVLLSADGPGYGAGAAARDPSR